MTTTTKEPPEKARKARVSLEAPVELVERLRDAVWFYRTSLKEIGNEALERELARLAKIHGPITESRNGRPLKRGPRAG